MVEAQQRKKAEFPLTDKQEAFAQATVYGLPDKQHPNQSEVYRAVYSASKMSVNSVYREAWEVSNNPKVAARVEELTAQRNNRAQKTSNITIDTITDALKTAMEMSIDQDNPQALTNAAYRLAGVLGLDAPKESSGGNIIFHIEG